MPDKYVVNLTPGERSELAGLTSRGKLSVRKLKRAQILLAADKGQSDEAISQTLSVGLSTIHRTRQKYVEGGLEWALRERPRVGGSKKLDSKAEALLVAMACSEPPAGRGQWTMQLLADRMVELKVVESLSDETVRRTLQKTAEALVERAMVFSHGRVRLCLAYGDHPRFVRSPLRPRPARGLL